MKKIVLTLLVILWMGLIFVFSSQNGNTSLKTSDHVTKSIIGTIEKVSNQSYSKSKKQKLIENTRVLIRKTAHFSAYLILGVLVYFTFYTYGIKRIFLVSILVCFVYAGSDEFHQLFLSGRTARIFDVCIDTIGSVSGIYLAYLLNCYLNKKYSFCRFREE